MNVLQNRVESFSNGSVQWPYLKKRYLQPDNLAKAGFYFMHKSDQVRCYLCDIELGQWKHNQSPFNRHANESPSCPLVLLQFPERSSRMNRNKDTALPFDTASRNARLATFHRYWPPNKRKRRTYPAVTKLADTGFYFSPTLEQIARIACPYCKLNITEPDKNMDFLGRHREDCIFLIDPPDEIKGPTTTNRRSTTDSTSSTETYRTCASGSSSGSQVMTAGKKRKRVANEDISLTKAKLQKLDEENAQTEENSSIWDIEKVLAPPSSMRKPTVTFGARKSYRSQHHQRQLASTKNVGSVDILAGLKIGESTQQRQTRASSATPALSFIVKKPQPRPVLQTLESVKAANTNELPKVANSSNLNDKNDSFDNHNESLMTQATDVSAQHQPLAAEIQTTSSSAVTSPQTPGNSTDVIGAVEPPSQNKGKEPGVSGTFATNLIPSDDPETAAADADSIPLNTESSLSSPPMRKSKGKERADKPRYSLPSLSPSTATAKGKTPLRLSSQHTVSQKKPSLSLSKTKILEQQLQQQSQETPRRSAPNHPFHQTLTVEEERLYLQSTPQRGNGMVHAHTIFGDDLPFSPIRNSSTGVHSSTSTVATTATSDRVNTPLLDTPMLGVGRLRSTTDQERPSRPPGYSTVPYTPSRLAHQQSRPSSQSFSLPSLSPPTTSASNKEVANSNKEQQRQAPERPNLPNVDDIPPPDVSDFVLTLSDEEKKMTVEQFIQSIVDNNVQKVKERGKDLVEQIRERSAKIKLQLVKQKEQLEGEKARKKDATFS